MAFKLRGFDALVEELGTVAKANKALAEAGIRQVHGMYDHGALEAVEAEPKTSNIKRTRKDLFTLAPTDGIGAIKTIADAVGLDLVRHTYIGSNYVTFRNAKMQRSQVKIYSRSSWNPKSQGTSYVVTDFLRDTVSWYYLFVCYQAGMAWVLSRDEIVILHRHALKSSGRVKNARVARNDLDNKNGRMRVHFHANDGYVFTKPAQVGL